MKVILTENQKKNLLKNLSEQDFTIKYTPEKIDEFVRQAENVLDNVEKVFNASIQKISNINIQELLQSPDETKKLLEYLENFHKQVETKNEKFYDVVELYEIGEYPDNIKRLDELFNKIDNKNLDLYYSKDALRSIIDASDEIRKLI